MQRHHIENIVPLCFSIISFYFLFRFYDASIQYFFGVLLVIVGLTIWWLGKLTLGEAFHPLPRADKLVTKGIYSRIRHPLYLGVSLMLVGWSLLLNSQAARAVALLVIIALIIRSKWEESVLEKGFGKKYLDYKKKTLF